MVTYFHTERPTLVHKDCKHKDCKHKDCKTPDSASASKMSNQDEWDAILDGHPIFDISKSLAAGSFNSEVALELSTNSFKSPFGEDSCGAADPLSGRRQVMTLKDADLIVAVGTELRIASLGDIGLGKGTRSYKVSPELSLHKSDIHTFGRSYIPRTCNSK